jgi:hypothetical protein
MPYLKCGCYKYPETTREYHTGACIKRQYGVTSVKELLPKLIAELKERLGL